MEDECRQADCGKQRPHVHVVQQRPHVSKGPLACRQAFVSCPGCSNFLVPRHVRIREVRNLPRAPHGDRGSRELLGCIPRCVQKADPRSPRARPARLCVGVGQIFGVTQACQDGGRQSADEAYFLKSVRSLGQTAEPFRAHMIRSSDPAGPRTTLDRAVRRRASTAPRESAPATLCSDSRETGGMYWNRCRETRHSTKDRARRRSC